MRIAVIGLGNVSSVLGRGWGRDFALDLVRRPGT
jgi:hypothetical protein